MSKKPKVMVCVTRQKTCERLITLGSEIAKELNSEITVVHVAKSGVNFLGNPDEGEAIDYLFEVSKQAYADMTVLRSEDELVTLVDFAKKNKITNIIMGESPDIKNGSSIIQEMQIRLPKIKFKIIPS